MTGVLKYWQDNRARYPVLSRIAFRYISAHAGSAILEQKFSVAGKNDDRRRHLGEWMQRILLTIAGNREWHHNLGGLTRIVVKRSSMNFKKKTHYNEKLSLHYHYNVIIM